MCLWTETKSRSINSQKKKKKSEAISSHLDRTNLVNKGFIIWLSVKYFLRDTACNPVRAIWLHLARSGSQSHRTIWFILPARGASHIVTTSYWPRSFFASLWTSTSSRSINAQKKELGQYPAILTSHLVNNPYLLTEHEGPSEEYRPKVVTVGTGRSKVRIKTTKGQYSPVRIEIAMVR